MDRPKYSSHPHGKTQQQIADNCRYCKVDRAWGYNIHSIRPTPNNPRKSLVMCLNKHVLVLTDSELLLGCPICGLKDPTIHAGASYVSRANNLIRRTCPDCNQVYFSKYGTGRRPCEEGHAILSDADSVRVNVIAALEAVLGQTADDWFFHYDTGFAACAMGYKVAAFIGTPEEYLKALEQREIEVTSTDYSMQEIIDPRMPRNNPYLWLLVRIDPSIAHDFAACVQKFIEGTNLHEWLQSHRNQDIQARLDHFESTGIKFSLETVRPPFPKPISLNARRPL